MRSRGIPSPALLKNSDWKGSPFWTVAISPRRTRSHVGCLPRSPLEFLEVISSTERVSAICSYLCKGGVEFVDQRLEILPKHLIRAVYAAFLVEGCEVEILGLDRHGGGDVV